ncbi:MAG: hypothetical protein EB015_05910 [Methylocystaceae bacterium]|nr:hypothetical protein [Methylocystaceae bacterium]
MPIRRSDDNQYVLASNASATGSAVQIKGGEYHFMVEGTVGSSTISLQIQTPNGSWAPISIFSGSLVSTTTLPFSQACIALPAGNVRMAATGGTPSALYAYLVGIG